MSIVAVIPARGGSKRIPRKNIRELHGKPMIAYTISAALDSGVFDRVIVSTDDEEIGDVSRSYGAEIPFLRDSRLADDVSPVSDVTIDVLRRLDSRVDAVAQLMPNCPLRHADDIKDSFAQFDGRSPFTQLSVTSYGWLYPWWAHRLTAGGKLEPLFPEALVKRSQDLDRLVCPTGAIWWARPNELLTHGTFYAPGYGGFELPWERALDIDDEDDWKMVEAVMLAKSRR